MQTKLTLRLDEKLIKRAKAYAKKTGKSISQMVADYFALLGTQDEHGNARYTPTVRSLKGVLRDTAVLFSMAESGGIAGYLCATTVTTIHSLATKVLGAKRSREEIEKFLSIIDIAPVNQTVLEGAMRSRFSDYEDAIIHEAALQVNATAIVTRNVRDFKRSSIAVYSPTEFVRMLRATEGNS